MDLSQVILTLVLGLILDVFKTEGKFLWFERAPLREDRCTLTVYGLQDRNAFEDVHPKPDCLEGGLLWLGTWGRVHVHFSIDFKTDFELCLTGGESNAVYIWYSFRDKYWEPLGFPSHLGEITSKEACRYSHNGVVDIFLESPWNYPHYLSFVTWKIKPFPDGLPKEEVKKLEDEARGIFDSLRDALKEGDEKAEKAEAEYNATHADDDDLDDDDYIYDDYDDDEDDDEE